MYITDLTAGDDIKISLVDSSPAYPTWDWKGGTVWKTGRRHKNNRSLNFSEGTGHVISNSDKVLRIRFVDAINTVFTGIAEIDYTSISSVYLYEGETNAATVAQGLNDPTTAPAINIYRKRVILRWTE